MGFICEKHTRQSANGIKCEAKECGSIDSEKFRKFSDLELKRQKLGQRHHWLGEPTDQSSNCSCRLPETIMSR